MPSVTYINAQGIVRVVEVRNGSTVMQGALENMIDGIVAECGGACACGTCHCYVDEAWLNKLSPPGSDEKQTLECSIDVRENSRLSCQIQIEPSVGGLVVRIPASQL